MFRQSIGTTPLSDNIASQYFSDRIFDGSRSSSPDNSFLVTLRALFEKKLGDGERIRFRFSTSSESNTSKVNQISSYVDPDSIECGDVRLHAFRSSNDEVNKAYIEGADKYFSELEGWKKLPRPTEYYAKTMNVRVFVNPEIKSVVIFCDSADLRRIHFLEAGMLSFFPWYFDPAGGISPSEKALCESLVKNTPDEYLAAVSVIAEELGFREKYKAKLLNSFETRFDQEKLRTAESELSDIERRLSDLKDKMSEYLQMRYDKQISVLGLSEKIARGGSGELGEYFSANKSLSMLDADTDSFTFASKGVLSYWDDDIARRMIENNGSVLYNHTSKFSKDQLQKLYTAVFIDRTVKLRVCAAFRLRPSSMVDRPHPYTFPMPEFNTYMPNTHIDLYGCIGTNEEEIYTMIENHDFIGVMEQCIQAALGFNFADSTVSSRFGQVLNENYDGYHPNLKAFELPDGTITDPAGVLKWIKEKEAE